MCASKAGGQGRLLMNNGCKNNRNKNRAGFKVLSGLWCVCFISRWSLCRFRLKRKKMHRILLLLLSNIGFRWLSVSILRIAFCIVNQNPILVKAGQEGCFSLIKLTAPPAFLAPLPGLASVAVIKSMRKWHSSVCCLTIDGAHSCVPSASASPFPPTIACTPPHRISKLVRSDALPARA